MTITVQSMARDDWRAVRKIYAAGLATGIAAFMTSPPKWGAWNAGHLDIGRVVARSTREGILGFAALSPVPDT